MWTCGTVTDWRGQCTVVTLRHCSFHVGTSRHGRVAEIPCLIQSDSGGKINILGGDIIGHFEKKKVHMSMCVILNVHRDSVVWISRTNSVRFLCVGLDTRDELMLLSTWRKLKINSDEQNATFAHESQSTLWLTIFEHLSWSVTNLSFF